MAICKAQRAWVLAALLAASIALVAAQDQQPANTIDAPADGAAAEVAEPAAQAQGAAAGSEEPAGTGVNVNTNPGNTAATAIAAAGAGEGTGGPGGALAAGGMPALAAAQREQQPAAAPALAPGGGAADSAAEEAAAVEEVDERVETEEQLEALIEQRIEPMRRKKVINAVVGREAPAVLLNGLGDVSPTGACREALARFCRKKWPGAGRLADCLREHLEEAEEEAEEAKEEGDEEEEDETKYFSQACRDELDAFDQQAASNVNQNLPLALACRKDIEAKCQGVDASQPGAILACLRYYRSDLRTECKKQVFKMAMEATNDLRVDVLAWKSCFDDAARLCPDVTPHGGRLQACLRSQPPGKLSWECKAQLFRKAMEDSDDVRTVSASLLKSCMGDKLRFCADIEPGESRVKDCLEDHLTDDDFSQECSDEMVKMIEARSTNFRMDSKIREFCALDVERMCGIPAATLTSENLTDHEESIQNCLQDYRKDIRNPACADRVNRMVALSMSDIRFNHPLADACAADRAELCADVPPGSARVIQCLKAKREQLSEGCASMLFDQEIVMAEGIDFQFPLKKACEQEVFRYCGAVPHGHARVIRCLEQQLDAGKQFTPGCEAELARYEERSSEDFRLNARLADACGEVVTKLCPQACGSLARRVACGGTVLRCLAEQYEVIDNEDCKGEVFYFIKMEVKDYRNDVFLAEACREDVGEFCQEDLEAGRGRVVECLHQNRERLTPACRKEETRLDQLQSSNIELRPSLARSCEEERRQHCGDVRPGKGRVLDCLVAKADQVDFSGMCRDMLAAMQRARLQDWRRDFALREACSSDAAQACGDALQLADAQDGGVYRCLLGQAGAGALSRRCAQALGRTSAAALQFYTPGSPGAEACDADVSRLCIIEGRVPQGVGQVRACLAKRVAFDRDVLANRTQILPSVLPPKIEVAPSSSPSEGGRRRELGEGGAALQPLPMSVRRQPLLSQACRDFLDVAEPEDGMQDLEASLATTAVLDHIAGVEAALGLEPGTLHNRSGEGQQVLTLTGWAALGAMFGLVTAVIGLVIYGIRRYTGPARDYALVMKHAKPTAPPAPPAAGVVELAR